MMLNLNDACRHANFIKGKISALEGYITSMYNRNAYLTKITENHLKSKAKAGEVDEVVEVEVDKPFTCPVQDIPFIVEWLIKEKLKLSLAIDNAKRSIIIDFEEDGDKLTLDSAIEYNKIQRDFAVQQLEGMANIRPSTTKKNGTGNMINNEGNQVPYIYTVEVVTEVAYNKDVIRDLYKKILNKTDIISTKINNAQLQEVVNYDPVISLHDSIDDIIEKYYQVNKRN
jgi:hypothetical protein